MESVFKICWLWITNTNQECRSSQLNIPHQFSKKLLPPNDSLEALQISLTTRLPRPTALKTFTNNSSSLGSTQQILQQILVGCSMEARYLQTPKLKPLQPRRKSSKFLRRSTQSSHQTPNSNLWWIKNLNIFSNSNSYSWSNKSRVILRVLIFIL